MTDDPRALADLRKAISGCDAVFPFDADRAYWGMKRVAETALDRAEAAERDVVALSTAMEEARERAEAAEQGLVAGDDHGASAESSTERSPSTDEGPTMEDRP